MSGSKDSLFNIWTCDKAGKTKITNRIFVSTTVDNDNTATLGTIRALLIKDDKLDSKKCVVCPSASEVHVLTEKIQQGSIAFLRQGWGPHRR
jgi:hypothetical protein